MNTVTQQDFDIILKHAVDVYKDFEERLVEGHRRRNHITFRNIAIDRALFCEHILKLSVQFGFVTEHADYIECEHRASHYGKPIGSLVKYNRITRDQQGVRDLKAVVAKRLRNLLTEEFIGV